MVPFPASTMTKEPYDSRGHVRCAALRSHMLATAVVRRHCQRACIFAAQSCRYFFVCAALERKVTMQALKHGARRGHKVIGTCWRLVALMAACVTGGIDF